MTFVSYFKKTLLILLSLGFIFTANAMDEDEKYFIATSAHSKAFEGEGKLNYLTDSSGTKIEDALSNKNQNLILLTKGSADKPLDAILKIFNVFVDKMQKDPNIIFQKSLVSGGVEEEEEEEEEEEKKENVHNLLVAGTRIKEVFGGVIKNVYAPLEGKGYNIGPNQARVSYRIDNLIQLLEFWHTEPASMEQFLVWNEENKKISNVLIVSQKPMCQFCSRFLLRSFFTEKMKNGPVNFMVFSLPALENIAKIDRLSQNKMENPKLLELSDLLLTVAGGSSIEVVGEGESSEGIKKNKRRKKAETPEKTVFDRIKKDLMGAGNRNYLSIYGF